MTLLQLRYLIAVAEYGSINAAAQNLYTSQSNLSTVIRDLELELGISIFNRSNRGVSLTSEGTELLGYARQVVEQADILESRYSRDHVESAKLSVSTQHYSFSVEAFMDTLEKFDGDAYDFTMRETTTREVIDDVANFRSEIGILYMDSFNSRVLERAFADANLEFTPLFETPVHVFVSENHPLASKDRISLENLDDWPRVSFQQGTQNSFYHSEEPLSYLPHKKNIAVFDRATLTAVLRKFVGYALATGVFTSETRQGIVAIPLDTEEKMTVGYLTHQERSVSELAETYIEELRKFLSDIPSITML